jgi:hypothetical protein
LAAQMVVQRPGITERTRAMRPLASRIKESRRVETGVAVEH